MPNGKEDLVKGEPMPAFQIGTVIWGTTSVDLKFNANSIYLASAVQQVAQQEGCVQIGFQLRSLKVSANDFKPGWFILGTDANFEFLQENHHLVAAPCPDFCSGGGPLVEK